MQARALGQNEPPLPGPGSILGLLEIVTKDDSLIIARIRLSGYCDMPVTYTDEDE